jgi:stage V sporulation protein AE
MNIDWMMMVKAFVIGGILCVIAQILIDKTKLTPARILVLYVTVGTVLGGLGWYKYLVDFAGCGATVPLTGFGNLLATGAIDAIKENGILGAFTGGTTAAARTEFLPQYSSATLRRLYQNLTLKNNNKI